MRLPMDQWLLGSSTAMATQKRARMQTDRENRTQPVRRKGPKHCRFIWSVLMVLRLPSYYQLKKTNAGTDEQSVTKRATRHNCLTPQITVICSWREEIASGCVGHNRLVRVLTSSAWENAQISTCLDSQKNSMLCLSFPTVINIYGTIIYIILSMPAILVSSVVTFRECGWTYLTRDFDTGDIVVFFCFRSCIGQTHMCFGCNSPWAFSFLSFLMTIYE